MICLASNWRSEYYPDVVRALRNAGHDVYDFRNPPSGKGRFKWSYIDENYMDWTPEHIYMPCKQEPELMYKLFDGVCCNMEELIKKLNCL